MNPVVDANRVAAVDLLRGLALLGILVVNLSQFASPFRAQGLPDPHFTGAVDQAVRWLSSLLFEGKFYVLFAFLFGYSFQLVQRRGLSEPLHKRRHQRRLIALAAIGGVHACVLYPGDVLLLYAGLGLVLLAWRSWSARRMWAVGLAILVALAAILALLGLVMGAFEAHHPSAAARALAEAEHRAQQGNAAYAAGLAETLRENQRRWAANLISALLFQGPASLAMFLWGAAAAQGGWLDRLHHGEAWWPKAWPRAALAAAVGLSGSMYYANRAQQPEVEGSFTGLAVLALSAPLLSAGYAVLACRLAWRRSRPARWACCVARAGRMTLTLYLMQSLFGAMFFTGWGAGAVGQVPPLGVWCLALAFYLVQLGLATWWLQRHAEGPLEACLQRWVRRGEASIGSSPA